MNIQKSASLLIISFLLSAIARGQFPQTALPAPSTAVTDGALSLRINPAGLAVSRAPELFLLSYSSSGRWERNGAVFASVWRLGFGAEFIDQASLRYNRYSLGSGFHLGCGLTFGFSHSWFRHLDAKGGWNLGLRFRPYEFVSLGFTGENLNSPRSRAIIPEDSGNLPGACPAPVEGKFKPRYNFGLALRPFGERFTVSVDASLMDDPVHDYGDSLDWTIRADLEPLRGIGVTFDYKPEAKYLGAGLSISFAHLRAAAHNYSDRGGSRIGSVHLLHFSMDRMRSFADPAGTTIVDAELSGPIVEEPEPRSLISSEHPSLKHILKSIRELENDDRVGGLALSLGKLDCGMATVQEIRAALVRFCESGKILVVYSEYLGNKEYYLASAADVIYMPPAGFLNLTGLAMEVAFLKGTLDKLGIVAEMENFGEYKSASETLTREGMSQAHREELNAVLDELYLDFKAVIISGRGMEAEDFEQLVNNGPYSAQTAFEAGLIDSILYPDQLEEALKSQWGNNFKLAEGEDYWKYKDYIYEWGNPLSKRIAIIYADGVIISGRSGYGLIQGKFIGAETLTEAIRLARENDRVKAIVMRVNSPGGDGVASDQVWREVKRTVSGKERKPFIVSMGDVAASGGYYISCIADTIVADPSTITGSIGVVSGKFDFSGLYEKIGLNYEIIKRGQRADFLSASKGWSQEEREHHRKMVNDFYRQFIERVSEGRNMPIDEVEKIAKGRIWTGEQAWELGLVDEIGTFNDAIQIAMGAAGFQPGEGALFEFYPKYPWMDLKAAANTMLRSQFNPDALEFAGEVNRSIILYNGRILYLMPYEARIE